MNSCSLSAEILRQLKAHLVTQFSQEYNDATLMSYDTDREAQRILGLVAERLDLETNQLWLTDMDRLNRSEWIDVSAKFLAHWTATLERCVANADDDQEMHQQIIAVKDLLFDSAVAVLEDDSQILDTAVGYIKDFAVMYRRNCEQRYQNEGAPD